MPKDPRLTEEVRRAYERAVSDLIVYRARFTLPAGILIFLAFSALDYLVYPEEARLFLWVRIAAAVYMAVLIGLSFHPTIKRHFLWLAQSVIAVITAGIIFMIYKTDGSRSHYYEGINLTFWGFICMNTFFTRANAITGIFIIALYELAVLLNPGGWDWPHFWFANSFLVSTLFMICLITKLYSNQHLNGFLTNEQLKQSEKDLEETNTKLARMYKKADELSKMDDLTKIYNRRYFLEILEDKITQCKETRTFFYLVLFDIDLFKQVNDRFGHGTGDRVLCAVVEAVQKNIRTNGFLGRYGGDEFVFVIDQADKAVFISRVEAIRDAVKNVRVTANGEELKVTVSIGAVKVDPTKQSNIQKIIELADQALLNVKKQERGTIHLLE